MSNISTPTRKQKLDAVESPVNPIRSFLNMGAVSSVKKYDKTSTLQKNLFRQLIIMIVKCMLPISLAEKEPFRKFIECFDPSFNMPTRVTAKKNWIP